MERRELDFLESLVKFSESKTVVEIGVLVGQMAVHLCRAANYNGGNYFGFDMWGQHGQISQFGQQGTKDAVEQRLREAGLHSFTLTQVDTINKRDEFDALLDKLCPNGIDFAFIDADHSYRGIANDFFAIYPRLTGSGVVAFHDVSIIDGCREFVHDLRTKYYDGTYDVVDFPFGFGERHCGVTILSKRGLPLTNFCIDEVCGSLSESHIIEQNEVDWLNKEKAGRPTMPKYFEGKLLLDNIGYYQRNKFEPIIKGVTKSKPAC